MKYRIRQTDEGHWVPQIKNYFLILRIPIFWKWENLGAPSKEYENAIANLKRIAKKIEARKKIQENRQFRYFEPQDLFKE